MADVYKMVMVQTKWLPYSLLVGTVLLVLAGCSSSKSTTGKRTGQSTEQVETIDKVANRFKDTGESNTQKLTALKRLEQDYGKYQQSKDQSQKVTVAYEKAISTGKQALKDQNNTLVKQSTVTDLSSETLVALTKQLHGLKQVNQLVTSEGQAVYTDRELATTQQQLEHQIDQVQVQIATVKKVTHKTISTEDSQKSGDTNQQSAEQAHVGNSQQSTSEMNFQQIEKGDFTTLMGSWREVAEGANHYRGQGFQWEPHPFNRPLSISKNELKDYQMTLSGNHPASAIMLTTNRKSGKATINETNTLNLDAAVGVLNWQITFCPKNVAVPGGPDGLDKRKEHIEIHTSNNDFDEIFERS